MSRFIYIYQPISNQQTQTHSKLTQQRYMIENETVLYFSDETEWTEKTKNTWAHTNQRIMLTKQNPFVYYYHKFVLFT